MSLPSADRECRICHGGVEAEAESGRLFSPCLCKGSMKDVHVGCLNKWREISSNRNSFYECDQCHYRYLVDRAKWAKWLESEVIVQLTSLIFFVVILLVAGYAGKWGSGEHQGPFWAVDLEHWFIGSVVVGMGGFFHLMVTFRIFDFHLPRSGNDKDGIGAIIMLIILVLGLLRAIYSVYQLVKKGSSHLLANMGTSILEVNATK